MKNDLIAVICMTLICATVMLGIMGLYRLIGSRSGRFHSRETEKPLYSVSDSLPFTAGKGKIHL